MMPEQGKQGTSGGKLVLPACGLAEDVLGMASAVAEPAAPEKSVPAPETLAKYVTFSLGEEEYGLPINQVQEINRVGEITRVPNSPEHVRGVINLRGRILPVIELKRRLNLGETVVTRESRIVVVEHGKKTLGLMVDRVAQVLQVPPDTIEPVPEEVVQAGPHFLKGVCKIGDRMIVLLELEKIVK